MSQIYHIPPLKLLKLLFFCKNDAEEQQDIDRMEHICTIEGQVTTL